LALACHTSNNKRHPLQTLEQLGQAQEAPFWGI